MITYQVVQPFYYTLSADTVNSAIKSFVKIHHDLNLNSIIIKDQSRHIQANLKYFSQDGRNRVGINTLPYDGNIIMGPSYANYLQQLNVLPGATGTPLTPIMPSNIWSNNYPLAPYSNNIISNGGVVSHIGPMSPIGFVPTIIDVDFNR
jgi:hypothetical protein